MYKITKINFLVIIISSIFIFLYENTLAQNTLDFNSFAAEFINTVPDSKEYFLENSQDYIKSIEYGESILEVPYPASEQYDWVKGYFENSIYTTYGDTIACFYIDNSEVLKKMKGIPQSKLVFKKNDSYVTFIGYFNANDNFIKEEDSYPSIVGGYVCSFKFIKEATGNWKLNIIDTGGE